MTNINIKEEIKKFADKFGQPFWLHSEFCQKRGEKHKESINACENCESQMMCTLALKEFKMYDLFQKMHTRINLLETLLTKTKD
jgi:hypothetical protein